MDKNSQFQFVNSSLLEVCAIQRLMIRQCTIHAQTMRCTVYSKDMSFFTRHGQADVNANRINHTEKLKDFTR